MRYYTTDPRERFHKITVDSYADFGITAYVWSACDDRIQPFYRSRSGDRHFYTTSIADYDNANSHGDTGEGIACYIYTPGTDPTPRPTIPLYAAYNAATQDYLYTTSAGDLATAMLRGYATAPAGFLTETIVGYVHPANSTVPGTSPLYWLHNGAINFYTASVVEKQYAIVNYGFVELGVLCDVFTMPPDHRQPIYHVSFPTGVNCYTADIATYNTYVQTQSGTGRGIAFYTKRRQLYPNEIPLNFVTGQGNYGGAANVPIDWCCSTNPLTPADLIGTFTSTHLGSLGYAIGDANEWAGQSRPLYFLYGPTGTPQMPLYGRLPIPPIIQQQTLWCWVALTQILDRYYNAKQKFALQCEYVCNYIKVTPDCCTNGGSCNVRTGAGFEPANLMMLVNCFDKVASARACFAQIRAQIDAGHPVWLVIQRPPPIGGHSILITGYDTSNGDQIVIWDPDNAVQDHILDFATFETNYPLGAVIWTNTGFTR